MRTRKKLSKKSEDLINNLCEAAMYKSLVEERGSPRESREWEQASTDYQQAITDLQSHVLKLETKLQGMTVRLKVVKHGAA